MSYICWFLLEIPHGSPHGPRPTGCHDRSLRGAELLRLGSAGHDPGFGHLGAHLHGRRGWLGLGKMFFFYFFFGGFFFWGFFVGEIQRIIGNMGNKRSGLMS